jgi:hypothetical protein
VWRFRAWILGPARLGFVSPFITIHHILAVYHWPSPLSPLLVNREENLKTFSEAVLNVLTHGNYLVWLLSHGMSVTNWEALVLSPEAWPYPSYLIMELLVVNGTESCLLCFWGFF